jgi:hypothetical protein
MHFVTRVENHAAAGRGTMNGPHQKSIAAMGSLGARRCHICAWPATGCSTMGGSCALSAAMRPVRCVQITCRIHTTVQRIDATCGGIQAMPHGVNLTRRRVVPIARRVHPAARRMHAIGSRMRAIARRVNLARRTVLSIGDGKSGARPRGLRGGSS